MTHRLAGDAASFAAVEPVRSSTGEPLVEIAFRYETGWTFQTVSAAVAADLAAQLASAAIEHASGDR
jgi:hypothetical protein